MRDLSFQTATRQRRPRRGRRGFTLIEAALATVIIGTGVLAIVAAQQAYHQKNEWAQRSGTAMLLANEIREMTLALPAHDPATQLANLGPEANEIIGVTPDVTLFDDLDDFAGAVDPASGRGPGTLFNPPINALRQVIPGDDMAQWTQEIVVERVWQGFVAAPSSGTLPALNVLEDTATGDRTIVRVTVRVLHQGPNDPQPLEVTSLSWLVPDPL
ncbi:MAG: prepilin-type N-terminal cleavage/methylation domain-containing protein [Planctomycetota bacterium]